MTFADWKGASIETRTTVGELVRVYEAAERDICAGCASIAAAEDRLNAILQLGEQGRGVSFRESSRYGSLDFRNIADPLMNLRRQVWASIVERLEVRRMMSIKKAKELEKWLETTKEDITVESVMGFFRYYVENLEDMIGEAVGEVYEILRPRGDRFKTNTQFELGGRVILEYWVTRGFSGKGFSPNYHRQPEFAALENVFSSLDGRGSISKAYRTELEAEMAKGPTGETKYFRFKCYKKGTLHLEFKRADLVKKFNQIAGGRRLRQGAPETADEREERLAAAERAEEQRKANAGECLCSLKDGYLCVVCERAGRGRDDEEAAE